MDQKEKKETKFYGIYLHLFPLSLFENLDVYTLLSKLK